LALSFDISSEGAEILSADAQELSQWMDEAFRVRIASFGRDLFCFSPTAYPYEIPDHEQRFPDNFISLSVTGTSCSLRCEHCDGHLLKGMEASLTPEALYERCRQIAHRGGEGVLISGGSDSHGHVPLSRFGPAIKRVKEELGLSVVVHTGLVDEETASLLAEAKIDAAMLDIIGDEHIAERVYHIADAPRKMRQSLNLLEDRGVPTVPHILVGLDYGRLGGEKEALQIISQGRPSALVIIALTPVRKTPMEGVRPPSPESIGRILTIARLEQRSIPLLLGCARPMGQHKIETDVLAVRSGVNGIALTSQEGVRFAESQGLKPIFRDVCCSLAYLTLG
jgi:uncharacterized radical SAM superfamily protein